jgi:hypothetical protein
VVNFRRRCQVVHEKPFLEAAKTQFVQDRIAERGPNNGYILCLRLIEDAFAQRRYSSYAEALYVGYAVEKFPLEAECIAAEIDEGRYVSPEEFQKMRQH